MRVCGRVIFILSFLLVCCRFAHSLRRRVRVGRAHRNERIPFHALLERAHDFQNRYANQALRGTVGIQFSRKPKAIDGKDVRQYLTRMKTTVSTKGQIILPAEFRQRDGVEPGQEFEVERIDRGEYRLKRKERRRNEGLVKLLLACPVKGWFKPMDRSETTDDINVPELG